MYGREIKISVLHIPFRLAFLTHVEYVPYDISGRYRVQSADWQSMNGYIFALFAYD
jgi:hypothetical protein